MQFFDIKRVSKKSYLLLNNNIEDDVFHNSIERFFYFDL